MFRPSRLTLHWLLWLVVVLLPLRGWAQVEMAAADGQKAHVSAPSDLDMPPCHASSMAQAHDAVSAAAGHTDGAGPPSGTPSAETGSDHDAHPGACSHCTVCHASLGLGLQLALDWPDLPHAAPAPLSTPTPADQPPSGLFRPPRRLTA